MRFFERFVFFLLLVSIPLQLGKHFWPDFSFVEGIRVDYLSPTLYVHDILFIFLFFLTIPRFGKRFLRFFIHPLFGSMILIVAIGAFFAVSPLSALYGIVKLLEFSYLAFYSSKTFIKQKFSTYTFAFVLGGLVETVIALFQFCSQRSLGGVFYFLGERTFDASTPGIAAFYWGEQFLMRPYGTFPHPNVLAFYLLCGFIFLLFSYWPSYSKKSWITFFALLCLAIGIFITFSRVVFVLFMVVITLWAVKYAKGMGKAMGARVSITTVLILGVSLSLFLRRFGADLVLDTILRLELLQIGFKVWQENILFGVGLQNFFYHEIFYQKTVTPTLLQPIHNIFLMWVVQTGLAGLVVLLLFLRKIRKCLKGRFSFMFFICIVTVGMFDHYLITLQQGQLMLSILIGICFSKSLTGQSKENSAAKQNK